MIRNTGQTSGSTFDRADAYKQARADMRPQGEWFAQSPEVKTLQRGRRTTLARYVR